MNDINEILKSNMRVLDLDQIEGLIAREDISVGELHRAREVIQMHKKQASPEDQNRMRILVNEINDTIEDAQDDAIDNLISSAPLHDLTSIYTRRLNDTSDIADQIRKLFRDAPTDPFTQLEAMTLIERYSFRPIVKLISKEIDRRMGDDSGSQQMRNLIYQSREVWNIENQIVTHQRNSNNNEQ